MGRLNLINPTSLVSAGLATVTCEHLNPRFGSVSKVNDKLFKYTLPGTPKEVFLMECVSLPALFEGIPQSIVGLESRSWTSSSEGEIGFILDLNSVNTEFPYLDEPNPPVPDTDELGKLFLTWVEFVGLSGLHRHQVELSEADGFLYVDAKNSPLYSGILPIQIK